MNENELRRSLLQTLENFQRCGLRRIHKDSASAALVHQTIQEWRSKKPSDDPTIDLPSDDVRQPRNVERLPPPAKKKPEPPKTVSWSSSDLQPLAWSDQSMPDHQRQTAFTDLDARIKACRLCTDICRYRHQTVFGAGPIRPTVCFLGEAPGADEDRVGQPFVGRAGQLLTKIIGAMQLRREEVYILNALKCRPPNNRTPTEQEISNCRPFVEAQLATLQPKYIVCLGAVAVRSLLNTTTSIGQLRGRFLQYHGAQVVATYHPAYLLRNEDAKRLVWDDMQMLMREMGISIPNSSS